MGSPWRLIQQPISVLGDKALQASDKSERDHAQFRCDLRSEKTAANFDDAAPRVFCRAARQAHIDSGGEDPLRAKLVEESSGQQKFNKHPGSSKLRHRNCKLSAYKSLSAARRSMTLEEIQQVKDAADREWDDIQRDPVQLGLWKVFNKRGGALPVSGLVPGGLVPGGLVPFRPLFGQSHCDRTAVLHSRALEDFRRAGKGRSDPEQTPQATLRISAAKHRCTAVGEGWAPILGCYKLLCNVCLVHGRLPDDIAVEAFKQLRTRLSRWVDSVGKPKVDEADAFLFLHGPEREDGELPHQRIVLLNDAYYRPKAQLFISCCYESGVKLQDFRPFRISLQAYTQRCGRRKLRYKSSDDLCLELLSETASWVFRPLDTAPDTSSASLLDVRCNGVSPEVEPPRRRGCGQGGGRRSRLSAVELELLALADGGADGGSSSSSRSRRRSRRAVVIVA